jgi:uncharacterized protein YjiS (DUF1127 family)
MNAATSTPLPVASPLALSVSLAGSPWQRLVQVVSETVIAMRRARRERAMRRAVSRMDPHLIEDLGLQQWATQPRRDFPSEFDRMLW